jgi:type IV secretory pathway VirB2 component (pilin)
MKISSSIRIFYAFILLTFGSIGQAYAATPPAATNAIETVLCNVIQSLTGPIGRMVGTIAVVALAIGLFLGKLSWGLAVATGIGVAMLLGAAQVVTWLSKGVGTTPGNPDPLANCPTT